MNSNTKKWLRRLSAASLCVGLAACGGSNNNNDDEVTEVVTREFRIDVVNLTAAQPFSPVAIKFIIALIF